jgi:hypothetical protein
MLGYTGLMQRSEHKNFRTKLTFITAELMSPVNSWICEEGEVFILGSSSTKWQLFFWFMWWRCSDLVKCFVPVFYWSPVWKTEITAVGDPPHWPCDTLYPQKVALTSPTSGGLSVRIVWSRTKATELDCRLYITWGRVVLKLRDLGRQY